jgi:hypothetical protein
MMVSNGALSGSPLMPSPQMISTLSYLSRFRRARLLGELVVALGDGRSIGEAADNERMSAGSGTAAQAMRSYLEV